MKKKKNFFEQNVSSFMFAAQTYQHIFAPPGLREPSKLSYETGIHHRSAQMLGSIMAISSYSLLVTLPRLSIIVTNCLKHWTLQNDSCQVYSVEYAWFVTCQPYYRFAITVVFILSFKSFIHWLFSECNTRESDHVSEGKFEGYTYKKVRCISNVSRGAKRN